MNPVFNYSTAHSLSSTPHCPPSRIMTTFESWPAGDTPPNFGSHLAATAALSADIGTLTAAKDTLQIIPVKVLFESVIVILGLVRVRTTVLPPFLLLISRRYGQDGMANDNAFVELATCCVRSCHVLKTATEGTDISGLNGLTKKAIESLEKYVVQPNLLCQL